MTTHSVVLLDPTESLPHPDVRSGFEDHPRLGSPVTRQSALVVQARRERPADVLVDVLLAHGLDPAVVVSDAEAPADPEASFIAGI